MALEDFTDDQLRELWRRAAATLDDISNGGSLQRRVASVSEARKELEGTDDEELFWRLVKVVFHAGMRAETVEKHYPAMRERLSDWSKVRHYGEDEVARAMSDPGMIRHEGKIRACVENAKVAGELTSDFGSFRDYLLSFGPWESYEGVDRLCADLQRRFKGVGPKCAQHFASWCGFPVVKADVHVMRIFSRIGLVERDKDEAGTIRAARRLAEAAGIPPSAVDSIVDMGLNDYYAKGSHVCGLKPDCTRCRIGDLCQYWANQQAR